MIDDYDPKKHVVKLRKGKPILVDKQILRWRKKREKVAKQLAKEKAELDAIKAAFGITEEETPAQDDKRKKIRNIFE